MHWGRSNTRGRNLKNGGKLYDLFIHCYFNITNRSKTFLNILFKDGFKLGKVKLGE